MLFWIFVIFLIIGCVLSFFGKKGRKIYYQNKDNKNKFCKFLSDKYEDLSFIGNIIIMLNMFAILMSLLIIRCSFFDADAKIAKYNETYKALTYKLESDACKDDFGLLNKEIIDDIQEWNEDVVYYQTIQDSFWLGIFYPNVFDQFKTIDLRETAKETSD